jgi:hypothetical protein
MKNISILGGGTAGWITALYINKWFPNANVTVISNEKIGIVGVGEATTPQIISFLNDVDIDISTAMNRSNATIKSGISFENWNGDGKRYFHGFGELLLEHQVPNIFKEGCINHYINSCIKQNKPLNEYLYLTSLSYKNKVDVNNCFFALHFDTNLMGSYLREVALSRGVKNIDDTYLDCNLDNDDNITSLVLENCIWIQ